MIGQGVRWTAEQVLALAPDDASRRAGSRLSRPGPWREAGAGESAVWGLCEGSGSTPYRTAVDLRGGGAGSGAPGYRCSCPSRKFPCKHALGLLLLWAGERQADRQQSQQPGPTVRDEAEPPEWVLQWLAGRRERADRAAASAASEAEDEEGTPRTGARHDTGDQESGRRETDRRGPGQQDAAQQDTDQQDMSRRGTDPARRRAARRAHRMAAGASELEERLADLLRHGLAGADQAGYAAWDEMAARMVDAQAPGIAARIRELGATASSGSGWPERLLSECALLHLLDQGFLALEGDALREEAQENEEEERGAGRERPPLPEPLAATVRARVGLTVDTAELLADDRARIRDHWLVLAQRDGEEGRLTVRRIWLRGRSTGRTALLLSFGAAGRAPETALPVGSLVDASLAFYPGSAPLRAALGEQYGVPEAAPASSPPPGVTPREALESYGAELGLDPWLEGTPVVLRDVVPVPGAGAGSAAKWQVAWVPAQGGEGDAAEALPIARGTPESALWKLTAISGGGPLTVFGECGHRGFAPYTAWDEGRAVPL
ncbi:SWIM zinc finger family protein [Streptomyces sp. ODS28]|uniref:SWIM zinc finger family protein n=1 Tax=Streptomyces sp. ODS28 TaxID=3136688 RepID=UPI0031EEEB18